MYLVNVLLGCLFLNFVKVFSLQPEWVESTKDGFLQSRKDWVYLSQLCFGSEKGVMVKFEYKFSYFKRNCCQNVLIYDEQDWPKVQHNTTASCEAKQSVLLWRRSQRIINLTESDRYSGCSSTTKDGYIRCSGRRKFLARTNCWHFVLSNCNSGKGIQTQYYISIKLDRPEELGTSSKSTLAADYKVEKALSGAGRASPGRYLGLTTLLVFMTLYVSLI